MLSFCVVITLNIVDHGLSIQSAVNAPRMHSQLWPDETRIEQGFSPDTVSILKHLGHKAVIKPAMGSAQTVSKNDNPFYGAADPRREGALAEGD